MPRDVELGAQQLFDVDSESDSADEEHVYFWFELMKPLGGRRPILSGCRGFLSLPGWSLFDNGSSTGSPWGE